jgi:phage tail-like protein
MAPKRKKPQRSDPYRNYTFRVKWDGQVVAGVSRVSALKRTTEIVEYREGGDAGATHKMPGRTH